MSEFGSRTIILLDPVSKKYLLARCDPNGYLYVSAIWPAGAAVDVTDRWMRQLGQIDVARVLGAALTPVNPVIAGIFDALGNRMPAMDNAARPGYQDVIDRLARVLGQVDLAFYRGLACGAVNPLDVQIIVGGVVIDPRNITGTVTANAGINLNTSLLALEAGGNLATIAGKDFATQTTLALIKLKTDNLNVLLSTIATEITLAALNAKVTACNTGAIAGSLTQSTKHDSATYKTALFYGSVDGNIVPAVALKKIKVHYLDVQAQGTVTVTIRDNNAGGARLDEWKLQDREGAVKEFVQYPASHYVNLQVAGNALYCDVSAAIVVKICVIYTDADAA